MSLHLEVITRRPSSEPRPTPLLFVHGAWHGAWCWDVHFLPYFAQQGYVCHALSLRGHGTSDNNKSLRFTRIADYVNDVAQVAGALETPPVVIGHSMGGFVVQKYLEKHDAPAAVLLASVPSAGGLAFFLRFFGRHPLQFLKAHLTFSGYPFVETLRLSHESFFSRDFPPNEVRVYFKRIQPESLVAGYDTALFNLPHPERVKTPMLVLGAANDRVFTNDEVHATARAYHTTAQLFPNMAHDMMLEAGWQTVADRIVGWLAERGL
jgi:pimeloyl-ACP methyl ester carboxylesterase